jgi:malonyl-CoA decarboxylase
MASSAIWPLSFSPTGRRCERYLADATAAVAQAADPPRQELLRRMNMAPAGTGTLIAMRSEITAHLHDEPELEPLDADLKHPIAS